MSRISKDEQNIEIAKAVSLRSTCLKRTYGAVIVKDDEIKATGYNGSPRGKANCCDIGTCQRKGIPQWTGYEKCCAVHAEMNALMSAQLSDIKGGRLYIYGYDKVLGEEILDAHPCPICENMIQNAELEVYNRNGKYKGNGIK